LIDFKGATIKVNFEQKSTFSEILMLMQGNLKEIKQNFE